MRRFVLERDGEGIVAEGVEFVNGRVAVCWSHGRVSTYRHLAEVEGQRTVFHLVWVDEARTVVDGGLPCATCGTVLPTAEDLAIHTAKHAAIVAGGGSLDDLP